MKLLLTVLFLVGPAQSWNDGSVLLRDIQALTLYKNRMTTARRSSPVPQLKCVGGSAGCHVFTPEAVQCLNRGWDGMDVQWECKTDMDNQYRFGRIEVSCEGYSHPADDYVLKGSCGLEYTLELTAEGQKSSSGMGGLGGFASSFFGGFSEDRRQQKPREAAPPAGEGSGDLLVVGVLLLLGFGVYKLFLSGDAAQQPGQPQSGGYGHTAGPPPPGFKPDFTGPDPASAYSSAPPGAGPSYGFHDDYTYGPQRQGGRAPPGTGGGFWTGMGTGGVLGYLFGRQRSQPYRSPPATGGFNSSSSSSSPSSSSSGTRTASGFGGTRKR